MPLSKPFVVATEGPTVDGRVITGDQIKQMAANYDPAVYTAVANLEHYLSVVPDSLFKAYGKVVSLTTQVADVLGEKKLQLLAVVDASDEVVSLQKKGQKLFSSIEMLPNFIGKGVAYLSGLAFTDSPASLGTESMKFSIAGTQCERFGFGAEVEILFDPPENPPSPGDSLFSKIKALLSSGKASADSTLKDHANAIEAIGLSQKEALNGISTIKASMEKDGTRVDMSLKALEDRVKELEAGFAKIDNMPGGTQRPPANGASATEEHPGY
jgi:hypothetical protein